MTKTGTRVRFNERRLTELVQYASAKIRAKQNFKGVQAAISSIVSTSLVAFIAACTLSSTPSLPASRQ